VLEFGGLGETLEDQMVVNECLVRGIEGLSRRLV
jgi:hypothetical protein